MAIGSDLHPLICPRCQARLPAHSRVCDYCGAALLPPPAPPGPNRLARQSGLQLMAAVRLGLGLTAAALILVLINLGVRRYQSQRQDYQRLLQEGVPVMATVRNKQIVRSEDDTDYWVYYEYPVSQGGAPGAYSAAQVVAQSTYNALGVGQAAPARYVPGKPGLVALESDFRPPDGFKTAAMLALLGFFGLLSVALVIYSARRMSRLRWLTQRGVRTRAKVTRVWQEKDAEGGLHYHLAFEFVGSRPDGRTIPVKQQRSQSYPFRARSGESIDVVYLPEYPEFCELALSPR